MYVDTNKLMILPLVLVSYIAQQVDQVFAQQHGTGDQGNQHPNPQYPDYNYEQPPQDYGQYVQPPVEVPPADSVGIQCYSCFFMLADGHEQGMANCQDPFVKLDIPTVGCKGPCGKRYSQEGENEYTIHRACIPNCKEDRKAQSYTQCCSHGYCNTATSQRSSWISHLFLLTSLYVLLHHMRR